MNDYCSLLSLGRLQLVKSFSLENSLTEAIYMVKSQKLHFRATFSHFWGTYKWNKISDYCFLLSLDLIQLMTSFSLETSLTEAIYMVKSKKKYIFEPLLAIFEALNEWNKISHYCSLLSLGLIQPITSFSLEKSFIEAIYMVKSKKITFLSHF